MVVVVGGGGSRLEGIMVEVGGAPSEGGAVVLRGLW